MPETLDLTDHPERGRYELRIDGRLAGMVEYHVRAGTRILDHTEVDPAFAGRGVGSRLAALVLEDAIGRDQPIAIRCPFLRAYLRRHPEVAERLRTR